MPCETAQTPESSNQRRPLEIEVHASLEVRRHLENALRALEPPPDKTVSQWADECRYLSPEASAEPGKWHTDRNEPLRGIMDAINDPMTHTVVAMGGSQWGKTECGLNIVGYFIDCDPGPMLVVHPTGKQGDAETWSKDRFGPMCRDTPTLSEKVTTAKAKDSTSTILHKMFPGGHLTIVGSNAPSQLAARPIRILILEEIDRYPISAGPEGDPQRIAEKRTLTFWNRKIYKSSTPTIKGLSRIEQEFERSDKRFFMVPCPHCQHEQRLQWRQVKWLKDAEGNHLPHTAVYECEHCAAQWRDADRWGAISRGKWLATAPFKGIAGFHVWQAYSTFVRLEETVTSFLDAKKEGREGMKVWVNTVLGESFEDDFERVEPHVLAKRREAYNALESLPVGVVVITAAVDVQKDRLEVEIVGWGRGKENWGLEYIVIPGDLENPDVRAELDNILLNRRYRHPLSESPMKIAATCIDTGGDNTQAVYNYCGELQQGLGLWRYRSRVWAVKGASAADKPIAQRGSPRPLKTGAQLPLFIVGTDTAKDWIYPALCVADPGPQYCHFPVYYPDEYFEALTAEHKEIRYRYGRPYRVWVCQKGRRNEALDLRVYNLAALTLLPIDLEQLANSMGVPIISEPPSPAQSRDPIEVAAALSSPGPTVLPKPRQTNAARQAQQGYMNGRRVRMMRRRRR